MRKQTKNILFTIAELVLIGALGIYMYCIAFRAPSDSERTPEQIASFISDASFAELTKGDDKTLKRNFQMYTLPAEYVYYCSDNLMNVDELLIVKADEEELNRLEEAIESRLASQKQNFKGYGTTQTERLENAVTEIRGEWLFYGVSENVENWEEIFSAALRK